MKKIVIILSCIALIVVIVGIILSSSIFLALPSVGDFVENYYRNFNNKKFDYMYTQMTTEDLKKAMSLDEYKKIQTTVYNDLGPIKGWEKGSTGIKFTINGFFVTAPYASKREKGIAVETFTLKRNKKNWLLYRFDIKS